MKVCIGIFLGYEPLREGSCFMTGCRILSEPTEDREAADEPSL